MASDDRRTQEHVRKIAETVIYSAPEIARERLAARVDAIRAEGAAAERERLAALFVSDKVQAAAPPAGGTALAWAADVLCRGSTESPTGAGSTPLP